MQKGITNDPRTAEAGLIAGLAWLIREAGRVVRESLEPTERP